MSVARQLIKSCSIVSIRSRHATVCIRVDSFIRFRVRSAIKSSVDMFMNGLALVTYSRVYFHLNERTNLILGYHWIRELRLRTFYNAIWSILVMTIAATDAIAPPMFFRGLVFLIILCAYLSYAFRSKESTAPGLKYSPLEEANSTENPLYKKFRFNFLSVYSLVVCKCPVVG